MVKRNNYNKLLVYVCGEFSIGKTTFIKQVSEINVVDIAREIAPREGGYQPTLGLAFGKVTTNDEKTLLFLFGEKGTINLRLEDFKFLSQEFSTIAPVLVLLNAMVVDMSGYNTKRLIADLRQAQYPFIVAINRHNRPDALPLEKIKQIWNLTDDDPIVYCNTLDRIEVCNTLITLLEQLPEKDFIQSVIDKIQEIRGQPSVIKAVSTNYYPISPYQIFVHVQVVGCALAEKLAFIRQVSDFEPFIMAEASPLPYEPLPIYWGRLTSDCLSVLYLCCNPDKTMFQFPQRRGWSFPLDAPEHYGVIVLVNASRPDELPTIRQTVDELQRGPFRFVIALIHRDAPHALTSDEVATALNLRSDIQIMPCTVTDQAEVAMVTLALLGTFPANDEALERIAPALEALT